VQPLVSGLSSLSDNKQRDGRRPPDGVLTADRKALLATAIIAVSVVVYLQFGNLRTHGGSCYLAPFSGTLEARGAATYIAETAVAWPPGHYAVPVGSGVLSVRDASGQEVARTGEGMVLTGGFSGGEFQVCWVYSRR
jgi:hypothetical protein